MFLNCSTVATVAVSFDNPLTILGIHTKGENLSHRDSPSSVLRFLVGYSKYSMVRVCSISLPIIEVLRLIQLPFSSYL